MVDLCSAPARLCASLRPRTPTPTRLPRWGPRVERPSGLDGACAQLADWQLRDGRRCDGAKWASVFQMRRLSALRCIPRRQPTKVIPLRAWTVRLHRTFKSNHQSGIRPDTRRELGRETPAGAEWHSACSMTRQPRSVPALAGRRQSILTDGDILGPRSPRTRINSSGKHSDAIRLHRLMSPP